MASIGLTQGLEAAKAADRLRPVRIWLYCVALMVMATLVVGGFTRMTGSGLSIATWKPISGVIPVVPGLSGTSTGTRGRP